MEMEMVIGLEAHVQLNTLSKLFSCAGCLSLVEPNSNITAVCIGSPGSLPLLNKKAVEKAVLFGLAVKADIAQTSFFDRKHYFYPDLPKNFQITQFFKPIIRGGIVSTVLDDRRIDFPLDSAHLEEDTAMLKHSGQFSGVDYNRAGMPLLEIVSMPCMRSASEAVAYAKEIKRLMSYVNASNCNMELGQMRFDANVSIRKKGEIALNTKTEIKNLNSFYFLELAINQEVARQIALYKKNEPIKQSTFRFDSHKKSLVFMRSKEDAIDYRYIQEPDIPPLTLSTDYISQLQVAIPELPYERYCRYKKAGMTSEKALFLISDVALSDYFDSALQSGGHIKTLTTLILVELLGKCQRKKLFTIPAANVAKLACLIDSKTITTAMAKKLLLKMIADPGMCPQKRVKDDEQFHLITDEVLQGLVGETIKKFPKSIVDYKNGKTNSIDFLVGKVLASSRGRASPDKARSFLLEAIR